MLLLLPILVRWAGSLWAMPNVTAHCGMAKADNLTHEQVRGEFFPPEHRSSVTDQLVSTVSPFLESNRIISLNLRV